MRLTHLAIAISVLVTVPSTAALGYEDERLEFAASLEETLGHFRALELNLDEGDGELAMVHATHPIAELYTSMKPVLRDHDPNLDATVLSTLEDLGTQATTNVPRSVAQAAIDDAKEVVETARLAIIGDAMSNNPAFKLKLMKTLLETSVAEYHEAVSDGTITNLPEFQDGSAFVWRSQQIFDEISSSIDAGTAREINAQYDRIWSLYSATADPSEVEAATGLLMTAIDGVLGYEDDGEEDKLLAYVDKINSLLAETKSVYREGDVDLALSLATKAYLDNYEFLEMPLVEAGERELMEDVEVMMREELINMMRAGEPASKIDAQVDMILDRMETVAVIIPEFGFVAILILAVSVVAVIATSLHAKRLFPQI